MTRTHLLIALALLGFVSTVLSNAVAPLPTAAHLAQQLPTVTPTADGLPPDTGGVRGFDLGISGERSLLDGRAERLLDN